MMNLIRNEWQKLFFRKNNYRSMLFIVLIVAFLNLMPLFFTGDTLTRPSTSEENWRVEIEQRMTDLKEENKQLAENDTEISFGDEVTQTLNLDEMNQLAYYLNEGIQPPATNNFYDVLIGASSLNLLLGIFVVIAASGLVAEEFSMGTIKLLLTRSHSRSKILTAKYIALIGLTLFYYGLLYLPTILIGLFTAEMNPTANYVFMAESGLYTHTTFSTYLAGTVASNLVYLLLVATIAFSISTISRNTTVALGSTLGAIFLGPVLTSYLASKTAFARFLLMANWNLTHYLPGNSPLLEDLTLPFSLLVNSSYLIAFLAISYYLFNKKDILT